MTKTRRSSRKPTAAARRGQRRPTDTVRVPIGVEKVLYLAATRPAFRRRLAEDRPAAIAEARVRLTDAERATLLGVPARSLETMIDRIRPAEHGRRRFMKTVAAATVSLAASMVTEGCFEGQTAGIDPGDYVEPRDDVTVAEDTGDEDAADVTLPPDATEGISPDVGSWDTAEEASR